MPASRRHRRRRPGRTRCARGYDDDLAAEATRVSNRIRGLLTGIHPALERAIGPQITHPAVLQILSRCGGPTGIRAAGRHQLTTIATKHAPRMGTSVVLVGDGGKRCLK